MIVLVVNAPDGENFSITFLKKSMKVVTLTIYISGADTLFIRGITIPVNIILYIFANHNKNDSQSMF